MGSTFLDQRKEWFRHICLYSEHSTRQESNECEYCTKVLFWGILQNLSPHRLDLDRRVVECRLQSSEPTLTAPETTLLRAPFQKKVSAEPPAACTSGQGGAPRYEIID